MELLGNLTGELVRSGSFMKTNRASSSEISRWLNRVESERREAKRTGGGRDEPERGRGSIEEVDFLNWGLKEKESVELVAFRELEEMVTLLEEDRGAEFSAAVGG